MEPLKVEKEKMIEALRHMQKAMEQVGFLWEQAQSEEDAGSGVTRFDAVLTKHYPFAESFFDVTCNVRNWVESATEELEK